MKKIKKLAIVVSIVNIFTLNLIKPDNRIVIYLKNAPQKAITLVEQDAQKEKLIKKIEKLNQKTPSQINNKFLKGELRKILQPNLNGFIALYAGYMDYSNANGLISFPLRHTEPKIYVAITPRINLVKLKENTISHAEYVLDDENVKTEIYKFEKKKDNKGHSFWHSEKQNILDKKINSLTVVILSKPNNFYVALGDFLSNDSKQIVLNDNIYVLGKNAQREILLNTLDIKRFFEPIDLQERKIGEVKQEMIMNT
ncbi:MAG: hypothetical protein ABIA74_02575 [bacterium]